MKASPRQQLLLLDLQEHDTLLARLRRRRRQLPEREALAALRDELTTAKSAFMAVQRERDAQQADITRLEADIETVRQRRHRDADLLAGNVTPREAESLLGELETLERRQEALEERELELMAANEETQQQYEVVADALARVDGRRAELTAALQAAERQVDIEIAAAEEERAGLAAELQRDLLELYNSVREQSGIGAARLRGNVSEGSNIALAPAELQEIRAAAPDEIIFCPGSGAILVRVDETETR